jgi:hypothetical protein
MLIKSSTIKHNNHDCQNPQYNSRDTEITLCVEYSENDQADVIKMISKLTTTLKCVVKLENK